MATSQPPSVTRIDNPPLGLGRTEGVSYSPQQARTALKHSTFPVETPCGMDCRWHYLQTRSTSQIQRMSGRL
ncbi:hypothetical protein WJX75_009949 [Coccomyxa subellipsoidea]|uniref:Uncharacterized protein n=1 Tax=Coccomyxa subellipsoidea TaxID=248742 RepID=A0ABR2Z4R5_9CHLO